LTDSDWPRLPADLAANADLNGEWSKAVGAAIAELEKARRMQVLTEEAKRAENALAIELLRAENFAALDRLYIEDDEALHRKTEEEMMDVAKASIERGRDSAKFVQVAATAVAGIYTGVFGLSYSVAENPLPTRGLIPTLFLGLAIALATSYLGFLTEAGDAEPLEPAASPRANSQNRTDFFVMWTRGIAMNRANMLRAGVVSFVLGVVLLPISLVDLGLGTVQGIRVNDALAFVLTLVGVAIVALYWLELLPRNAKTQRQAASTTRPRPTIR
jgi:hypothetical protein